MPSNLVKTESDEKAWERAKAQVRKEYPNITEGTKRFYKLVVTIFKDMSMAHRKPKSKIQEVLNNA